MALKWFRDKWPNRMSEVSNLDMRRNRFSFEHYLYTAGVSEAKYIRDDNSLVRWFYKNWEVRVCYGQINVVDYSRHAGTVHWNDRSNFDVSQI